MSDVHQPQIGDGNSASPHLEMEKMASNNLRADFLDQGEHVSGRATSLPTDSGLSSVHTNQNGVIELSPYFYHSENVPHEAHLVSAVLGLNAGPVPSLALQKLYHHKKG